MYKVHAERSIEIAHKLTDHNGKCANLHGHSMKFIVDVYSTELNDMGMVIDFGIVKEIIDKYDHKYLNDEVETKGAEYKRNPTAERMAYLVAQEIDSYDGFAKIVVKVYEKEGQYAEYTLENN